MCNQTFAKTVHKHVPPSEVQNACILITWPIFTTSEFVQYDMPDHTAMQTGDFLFYFFWGRLFKTGLALTAG